MSTAAVDLAALGRSRLGRGCYLLVSTAVALLCLVWLGIGAVVAVAAHAPSVAAELTVAAAAGGSWAGGVLAAVPHSEPLGQAVLDYAFSLLNLVLAGALLVARRRSWSVRLLALGLMGSAGAFNLQAHAATAVVQTVTGLAVGGLHQLVLHGVAVAAYLLALLVFPSARITPRGTGVTREVLIGAGAGAAALGLVGLGTAFLPHVTSYVLLFGFGMPIAGIAVLARRLRPATPARERTQVRLVVSVLVAALAVAIVLAVTSLLLWSMGWAGVTLVDPTGSGAAQPTALLFWFSRLAGAGIAGAVLVSTRRAGPWAVERSFSRGLVAALVATVVGGGYVLVHTVTALVIAPGTSTSAVTTTVTATAVAALAFLPVYERTERLVDRLLYGTRPTPYSVLSGIAALSRSTPVDAPDLTRVAEAVGRGLGATACRLTVLRPGLRDRTYAWEEPGAPAPEAFVEVAVRQGAERIGTLAVDRAALAGLHEQRRQLLDDIAEALGAVLQASRAGIELERQLRAALAHAQEIAVARRRAVAEMDAERRRIERDLHDGAQHHLVSLRLTLGLVEHQVSTAQFDPARARLEQVAEQIDAAEAILAETAAGVSSPLLAEAGLVAALRTELGGGQPPVLVEVDGVPTEHRFPSAVETAVYFCCLEAVGNAHKHAPGAAVTVGLTVADDRLHFTVHDEGPGWDPAGRSGAQGCGLRNVRARIAAVGGRIELHSEPGAGTTVAGSAPLPGHAAPPAAGQVPVGPPAATAAEVGLVEQVRDAIRAARECYHGTVHAEALGELAERLDGPLRIAVVGAPGADTPVLVEALESCGTGPGSPAIRLLHVPVGSAVEPATGLRPDQPPAPSAEAHLLVFGPDRADESAVSAVLHTAAARFRAGRAIGVLTGAEDTGPARPQDADRAATERGARPEVRRLCPVVVPVAARLARAAATLTEAEDATLRRLGGGGGPARSRPPVDALVGAGPTAAPSPAPAREDAGPELVERFGPAGLDLAVELIRSGWAPTRAALAEALLERSGLLRLAGLVDTRFTGRAEEWKAHSALLALETLVRDDPPSDGGLPLLYQLDRIRSGATELAEIDLVDALRAGDLELPDQDRAVVERLLGARGTGARARLGLAPGAGPAEIAGAAADQLAHWRRRASQPMVNSGLRAVAEMLVRICEHLLSGAAAR